MKHQQTRTVIQDQCFFKWTIPHPGRWVERGYGPNYCTVNTLFVNPPGYMKDTDTLHKQPTWMCRSMNSFSQSQSFLCTLFTGMNITTVTMSYTQIGEGDSNRDVVRTMNLFVDLQSPFKEFNGLVWVAKIRVRYTQVAQGESNLFQERKSRIRDMCNVLLHRNLKPSVEINYMYNIQKGDLTHRGPPVCQERSQIAPCSSCCHQDYAS